MSLQSTEPAAITDTALQAAEGGHRPHHHPFPPRPLFPPRGPHGHHRPRRLVVELRNHRPRFGGAFSCHQPSYHNTFQITSSSPQS